MVARLAPRGTKLPPYKADTTCPKCAYGEVGTTHYGNGCTDADCSMCDREHLRRICRGCGYQWAEAPIEPAATEKVFPSEDYA